MSFFNQFTRYSVLPALTLDSILYLHVVRGSFDGGLFLKFIRGLLQHMNPYPEPRSVLVMDNCAIHHVEGVAELCAERCVSFWTISIFPWFNLHLRGVKLLYLPPYSPDFNPIEECFSYMKGVIRRHGDAFQSIVESKDESAIFSFLSDTLATVTPRHAYGWFRHSNYL